MSDTPPSEDGGAPAPAKLSALPLWVENPAERFSGQTVNVADLYVKDSERGGYVFNGTPEKNLRIEDAKALRDTLNSRVERYENAKVQLVELETERDSLRSKVADYESASTDADKAVEDRIARAREEVELSFTKKLDKATAASSAMEATLVDVIKRGKVASALVKAEVMDGDGFELMSEYMLNRIEVVKSDSGAYEARMRNEDNSGHLFSDAPGSSSLHMKPEEYADSVLRKRYGGHFKGTGKDGGGTPPNGAAPADAPVSKKWSELSFSEQQKLRTENLALANSLRADEGKGALAETPLDPFAIR